jgi:hypothetical protein
MSKRTKYHVTHNDKKDRWQVKKQGSAQPVSSHIKKDTAVDAGRTVAKQAEKGQLIIHKENGVIQTEHTYGSDPYPPKG